MKRDSRRTAVRTACLFPPIVALMSLAAAMAMASQTCAAQSASEASDQIIASAGPEIGRISLETVKKLTNTDLHIFVTTPLSGCLGAPKLCAELDAVLHADLKKSIPDARFIPREEAMKFLAGHGFLDIDAYAGALDVVASHAGAEAVVGEDFQGGPKKCQLHTTLVDVRHHYELESSTTAISCSVISEKTRISLLKDDATGVSMIVALPQSPNAQPGASPIRFPSCAQCPNPHYSEYARYRRIQGSVQILVTVTEQGAAQNPKVLGGVEESLERVSLDAVKGWKFKPAIGDDGMPFPARVKVEMTFSMAP